MGTTTLIIARHGNTFEAEQVPTRVGARTDLPLVSSGEEQALRLGHALKNSGLIPNRVFTSTLQRTITTARLVCVAMACDVVHEPAAYFDEIDYGPDENRPDSDVVARIGAESLKAWDKDGTMPEGWSPRPEKIIQNWKDFLLRVQNEFKGQQVLVVTSNGVARFAAACTVNGADFPLKLATGCYGVITSEGHNIWRMQEWNTQP